MLKSEITFDIDNKTLPFARESSKHCLPSEIYNLLDILNALKQQENFLDISIQKFQDEGASVEHSLDIIHTLHNYNELKDIVSCLFSYISKLKNITVKSLYEKYNVPYESEDENCKKRKRKRIAEVTEATSSNSEISENSQAKKLCIEESEDSDTSDSESDSSDEY